MASTKPESCPERLRCEEFKRQAVENPRFKILEEALQKLGCPLNFKNIDCEPCDSTASAKFLSESGKVVICQNNVRTLADVENNLIHEAVHAHDWCKFKINLEDCRHIVCTEIRAANLSDDCNWLTEMARGHFNISKQHQLCTKRRAVLSASYFPACGSLENTKKVADEVFESCYRDRQPFHPDYWNSKG
ncbi:Mitochondrial inner membrane protease atp23 [Entomophthora muscae]|nr:Mitochondrial inner membrane protease atp23 [Entomophthora muscae]